MFEDFFDKCEINDPEMITAEQSKRIETTLQKRIAENSQSNQPAKEGNNMKTKTIRITVIAAAIAALGALGVAGAASTVRPRSWEDFQQIAEELAEKNRVSENFFEINSRVPYYDEMDEVNELIITATIDDWLPPGETDIIFLTHFEETVGTGFFIESDGKGGYVILGDEKPIEDEKLLAAIAEGKEKYGKSFMIWY